jgi:PAS domain S-box-containing protein
MGAERRSLKRLELSMLLESMPEGVFIFGPDRRILEANRAGEQMLLGKWESVRGKRLEDLLSRVRTERDGHELQEPELAVTRALKGEHVPQENRVFLLNGERKMEASVTAHPIRDNEGDVVGALVIIRDESELHLLQRRLADTQTHLAIGHMAADIAHDFNNVLSTISQAASVVEAVPPSKAQQKPYLTLIHNAVQRGKEIVERMREHVRGSKGEESKVFVGQLVGEALELARPRIHASKGIRLQTDMEACPPVWGNAPDLRRTFVNLILNAIEAMPKGGVLGVRCHDGDGKAMVEVRDTGTGIAPENQRRIFSPYFTTKTKGTGLGLTSSRQIVERHGGKLNFASKPGETVFTVELPAAKEERAA